MSLRSVNPQEDLKYLSRALELRISPRHPHDRDTHPIAGPPTRNPPLTPGTPPAPTLKQPQPPPPHQPLPTLNPPTATSTESHKHPDPSPPAGPPSTCDKNTPSAGSSACARSSCTDTARTGPWPGGSCTASTGASSCARSTPCGSVGSRSGI